MKCDICGEEKGIWGHAVCVDCYSTKKQDQIAKLKQQLAEKDEEIKLLKCEMVDYQVENEQLKVLGCEAFIRHQICEEIRAWLKNTVTKSVIGKKFVFAKLNQIEQGESKRQMILIK